MMHKWTPNLENLYFDTSKIMILVLFKRAPLEFFTPMGLGYTASDVGVSQYMDWFTIERSRFEYARVCLETDVKKVIPSFIEVVRKNGIITTIEVIVP